MSATPKLVEQAPHVSEAETLALLEQLYGLHASIRLLPSERDQNFLVQSGERRYVLKIANAAEHAARLDFQNAAMARLNGTIAPFVVPQVVPTLSGEAMTAIHTGGATHLLRLLTFVEGQCLAELHSHSTQLLEQIGRLVALIDRAFVDFVHADMDRPLHWDCARALELRPLLEYVPDVEQRGLVERVLQRFEHEVLPRAEALPRQVIYNDANDYNLLVGPPALERMLVGSIDFGDMLRSWRICDLAVAMAYAMLNKFEPLTAGMALLRGYTQELALLDDELAVLDVLVRTRLCLSVLLSAYQSRLVPDNDYLAISSAPAWALLRQLDVLDQSLALVSYRWAAGQEPYPQGAAIRVWLEQHGKSAAPVVAQDLRIEPPAPIDLSPASEQIMQLEDVLDLDRFDMLMSAELRRSGRRFLAGGYNEPRLIYAGELHTGRSIHLGIDLWGAVGEPVFAALDGYVHSFADNSAERDYGPTIIVRHQGAGESGSWGVGELGNAGSRSAIPDSLMFYTLYGHLSRESLAGLYPGKPIRRGEQIGTIGSRDVNGGWPAHLHFQVLCDPLGMQGDFPGVANPDQRGMWLGLCPDPNLLLGIAKQGLPDVGVAPEYILSIREQYFGRSMSISYRRPLTIVRGSMQYLYDHEGRPFLDAVNNVPLVGHSHPRVVAAAQRQMAILTTNTRYLHAKLARYLEELSALLPPELSVIYLVNSGSEANDLALRMARNHTGRNDVIVLDHAYHGHTAALIDISPYKFNGPGGRGAPATTHITPMPDAYRGEFRGMSQSTGAAYARQVAALIERLCAAGRAPAAFIAESALGCGGQMMLPPGYLEQASRSVRAAGGLYIADEVQVGFGRVGERFWGFETQGVVPDIVTMGKPIGNGHPLAAVAVRPEIADSFRTGMEYFNTFGGNPVSCAVGLAVLDVMRDEGLQAHALRVGQQLLAGFRTLSERHALIGDVRGLGMFIGVELVRNREQLTPADWEAEYIVELLRERGILLSTEGPLHNVLKIKPPLAFGAADAERLLRAVERVLSEDMRA